MPPAFVDRRAFAAATGAAWFWSTYYVFVLGLPASENLTIILFAPVLGGAFVLVIALTVGRIPPRGILPAFTHPRVLLAGLCLLGFQLCSVLSTRSVGAVNTSLIVLASDVIGTPLLFHAAWRGERPLFRLWSFWLGVALIASGGLLAILAGGSPEPISLAFLALGLPLFVVNSVFVVSTEAANRQLPVLAVLAATPLFLSGLATVGAAIVLGPGAVLGSLQPDYLGRIAAMGLLNYALPPVLFFWSARRISLTIPSILQAAIPVFTLVLVLALGLQPVTALALLAVPLAFVGATFAARRPTGVVVPEHETYTPLP